MLFDVQGAMGFDFDSPPFSKGCLNKAIMYNIRINENNVCNCISHTKN